MILRHLRLGLSLTMIEALRLYGIGNLKGRIFDLRSKGHLIQTTMVPGKKRGCRYAEYRMINNN